MKIWATWHGGPNYGPPAIPEHLETFDSLEAAKDETWRREHGRDPYYPGVHGSETWIYFYDPTDVRDPYPDLIVTIGPRGGVRVERC